MLYRLQQIRLVYRLHELVDLIVDRRGNLFAMLLRLSQLFGHHLTLFDCVVFVTSKFCHSSLSSLKLLRYLLPLLISIRLPQNRFLQPLFHRFGDPYCLISPHHQLD